MPRNNLNVPPPPPPPPLSGWKPEADEPEDDLREEASPEPREAPKPAKKKTDKDDSSGSSDRARTRARTNGQRAEQLAPGSPADIIAMLDSVRAHHGHPQLERASVSHRWPQWAIDTLSKKSQVEQRKASDILAEVLKRGFAGDPWAQHYYAEACDRVNARENDWELDEKHND